MKIVAALNAIMVIMMSAAMAGAFTTNGLQKPYGVVVDPNAGIIYVSNLNGNATAHDDDGFISRLKPDGTVDVLKFIDGAGKDITLDAPKGMAIVRTTLYVADIDKLRAFDLGTGKHVFDVNFGDLPVRHFYDISTGPDDALYLTDGPANIIYRIDIPRFHEVTTFASGDLLGQPHGIFWFPAQQVFMVAGWSLGQVVAFDKDGKRRPIPGISLKTPEMITGDETGNVYVSSAGFSAVFRIAQNYALSTFALGQNSPMGLAYQKSARQVVVTSQDTGTIQSFPVGPPPK